MRIKAGKAAAGKKIIHLGLHLLQGLGSRLGLLRIGQVCRVLCPLQQPLLPGLQVLLVLLQLLLPQARLAIVA